jgi:hypothetical protein
LADLFRSVAGRVKDGASRVKEEVEKRRADGEKTVVSNVDDDPDAEPLPPLETAGAAELAALDAGDAPPVNIPAEIGVIGLFGNIDPPPPLPLTGPHEVGLAQIIRRIARLDRDLADDSAANRLIGLLGGRISITVSPDGLTVRGTLRTRHTPWAKVKELRFTSRYDLLRGGIVEKMAEDMTIVPIPGLQWLLRRVLGGVAGFVERRRFSPEEIEEARTALGWVLTDIDRRGLDIELSGPLRSLTFLSAGLSVAIQAEAEARGIPVVREEG